MNFDFSDDLKMLREQARKFLAGRCSRPSSRPAATRKKLPMHTEQTRRHSPARFSE